jgi:hypothetical protein
MAWGRVVRSNACLTRRDLKLAYRSWLRGAGSLLPNVVHYVHTSGDRQALADFKQRQSVEREKEQSFGNPD